MVTVEVARKYGGSLCILWLLFFFFSSSILAHASSDTQQCLIGDQSKEPGCEDYICSWRQGILRKNIKTGGPESSNCMFMVRDPAFLDILTFDSKLEIIAHTNAHEGGVYFPSDHCFYFSTTKEMGDKPNTKVMKVHLDSGRVERVKNKTEVANGMVLDLKGHLIICHQGVGNRGGYLEKLDLSNLESEILADNWFGHPFNSPNDVVVKGDGSVWFTDPDYGWHQGFKAVPRLRNQVYRVSPSGVVDAVADGFVKPNGIAFSHDEKRVYISDTGSTIGNAEKTTIWSNPHSVIVFDVGEDGVTLHNRRLFASISSLDGSYEGVGCPDGIKVDTKGRVYVANPDGVQVLSPEGKVLGLIRVPGAANMGFAGRDADELVILNDTSIHTVHLATRGAGLHYLSQHGHSALHHLT